jgi:hypothetical protein
MDMYPRGTDQKRLLDGASTDLLNASAYVNVTQFLNLNGGVGYSLNNSRVETAQAGLTVDPRGRWRLSVSERFNYRDTGRQIVGSDYIYVRFEYQLSERWGLIFDEGYQRVASLLDRKGIQSRTMTVTRRYGPLVGRVSYRLDRLTKASGVHFSLAPAFAYRNLVVPTDELLVHPTEVGEAEEAPEERNFDPYELLKKRRAKGPAKPSTVPAPPPAPEKPEAPPASPAPKTGTGEVPAPPADVVPLDGRGPAASARPGPAPRTRPPLDQDDWAATSSAPTP